MSIKNITADDFSSVVLNSDIPVLVDFYASWCGPCKMLAPTLDEIANECPHIKVCKVDIDAQQDLAMQYRVMSVPTLILFKNGQPAQRIVGVQPKSILLNLIEK